MGKLTDARGHESLIVETVAGETTVSLVGSIGMTDLARALATAKARGLATPAKWSCPKCGAEPNRHGDGGAAKCKSHDRHSCEGFLCNCDEETSEEHGETRADPCHTAACHHCGWSGTYPRPLRGMKPWEKTALAAGWTPPAGWEEALKDSGRVAGEERSAT